MKQRKNMYIPRNSNTETRGLGVVWIEFPNYTYKLIQEQPFLSYNKQQRVIFMHFTVKGDLFEIFLAAYTHSMFGFWQMSLVNKLRFTVYLLQD